MATKTKPAEAEAGFTAQALMGFCGDTKWAVEIYHAHFGWLRWEDGDRTFPSKRETLAAAAKSAYPARVRIAHVS